MKKQSGFTLIELLLVLAIIGIIAAIAIPALLGQREKAKVRATEALLNNIIGEIARGSDDLAGAILTGNEAHLAIHRIMALPNYRYPKAKNPYGGTQDPYRVHSLGGVGLVGIEWYPAFADPVTGSVKPLVIVRTKYRKGSGIVSISKFVAVD